MDNKKRKTMQKKQQEGWYACERSVPMGQAVQFVAELADVNVPAAQAVGTTTPEYSALAKDADRPAVGKVVDAWPNGLITHAVPATQFKQAVAPTAPV